MNNISTGVFDRTGGDEISESSFYAALTTSLLWGLVITALIAKKIIDIKYMPGLAEILIIGLVIPILGVLVSVKSDNPVVSFIGYNMIVIPFGIILGPAVNRYSPDVVRNAFGITAGITFIMGGAGVLFPSLFKNLGVPLFVALSCLIIVRIAQIFIPRLNFGLIDYIAAGIFSLYIGYDMYRASEISKTFDNAIDISIELYLDIINLFLTLLKILGKKD